MNDTTHRFRILLTPARALLIITLIYPAMAGIAALFFRYLEHERGVTDGRTEQVVWLFAGCMAALWTFSVITIARDMRSRR
jgi:hypothetical protein